MQAEGIRTGDRRDKHNNQGQIVGGWTATGDAVVEGGNVYIPIRFHDGQDGTLTFSLGTQVPLTFGVGS